MSDTPKIPGYIYFSAIYWKHGIARKDHRCLFCGKKIGEYNRMYRPTRNRPAITMNDRACVECAERKDEQK